MRSRIPTYLIGFGIPMTAVILLFPFWNRVEPFVFGFSFNYFWICLCLVLTSLCLYIAYKIDPMNDEDSEW